MADQGIGAKFSQAGLMPNIVPVSPKHKLQVVFHKNIEPGDTLHALDVRGAPKIECTEDVNEGDFFSIVMIDPDYPKRDKPSEAEFLHWLIPNINYDIMKHGRATGVKALVGYSAPTPIKDSGQHRIVVLLFSHPKRKISQPTIKDRKKFSVKDFMTKHNLGEPLAANYFVVEFDS